MSTLTDYMLLQANACEGAKTEAECPVSDTEKSIARAMKNAGKAFFSFIGGIFRTIGEAYWEGGAENRNARQSPYDYIHVRGIL